MAITQKYLKKLFDYKDGHLIRKVRRGPSHKGEIAGYSHHSGYRYIQINGIEFGIHRIIWCWHYGELPEYQIDHINRIKDDNRIENLRLAFYEGLTDDEANRQNLGIRNDNTSGHEGVSWHEQRKKWRARIGVKGKRISLGLYKHYEDACAAYDRGKTEYHKFNSVPCQAKKIEISA